MTSTPAKVLDDLPGSRCSEALALLQFLRRQPIRFFVAGSPSARVAQDLADCGYFGLASEDDGPIEVLRIVPIGGTR